MNMTTQTHDEATKGGTSASNAAADRLCPGRHLASRGLPDTPGEWAEHGQKIHAALADGGNRTLIESLTLEQHEMMEAHREIEKGVITKIWNGEPDQSNRVWREQRYWCKVPENEVIAGPHYLHSGQADFVMRRNQTALIQDYKSLAGEVAESPRNEQLRDLAVMVWRHLAVDEVFVAINQPLETWTPEICRYSAADLERAEQEMWDRVRRSNDPKSPRLPGEVQCKWCKAKGLCPEYAAWASSLLPDKPSPFTVFMQDWSLEQRSTVAEHLPRLKKLLEDAEDHLRSLLAADPDAVPGFYLKEGATREKITDAQELFGRFRAAALDKAAEMAVENDALNHPEFSEENLILGWFMKCVAITKKDLKEQVNLITKLKGKKLDEKLKEMLAGLTESKPNAPSLARRKE